MPRSSEEEYQRFLGFPAPVWPQWKLGEGWRRPMVWVRWRIVVRRRGPYAPDFKAFLRGRKGEDRGGTG
jgi:hypothetical protein